MVQVVGIHLTQGLTSPGAVAEHNGGGESTGKSGMQA